MGQTINIPFCSVFVIFFDAVLLLLYNSHVHTCMLYQICFLVIFRLIAFQILSSPQDIDKEISELKMSVNTRGRLVATEFLKQFL